jgi:pimeloyl-ACP methyl ester carboxylesterase
MVAPHEHRYFDEDDVRLSYRLFGEPTSRAPVLFVHGLSYFSYDWVDFGSMLCSDRAGCAMDMRGFGDSSESAAGDYGVPAMSEDICRLMDHLRWTRAILVAHSMGGRSAAWTAARHPSRVQALVLVDWSPENSPAGSKRVATTVANAPEVFSGVPEAMAYFGVDADSPKGAAARARYEAYLRPVEGGFALKRSAFFRDQFRRQLESGQKPKGVDLWDAVQRIAAPTLALRASRSDLFGAETVPRLLAANPRIEFLEIEGGHNLAADNAPATLSAIRDFIDGLENP